jgi:hypothetical protein
MTATTRAAVRLAAGSLLAASLVAGCGDGDDASTVTVSTVPSAGAEIAGTGASTDASNDDRFPEIIAVESTPSADGTWTFDVTVASPYDTPERYADGWRVVGPDGTVYGEHTLTHDHANEQPFTRRQTGVTVPDDVTEVTIEGRDSTNGFGGRSMTVTLAGD